MKTKTPIFPQRKKAFTLVELIIVITILAILATIAFVSFQGYSAQSRDSNRVATVKNIENGVNIFITKTGKVPEPDNVIGSGKLTSGGPVLNIVGKVGEGITRSININTLPLDPRAQEQYWYGVDTLRRYYQVGLTLESETAFAPGILPSYAGNILEAKVQGNYEYPLKLENIVYSLPSLLFLGSGGVLNNQTEFVVDEGTNVPYTFGGEKSGTQSVAEVLKIITGTGNLSLTGVSLPTMTMSDYKASTGSEIPSAFSGVAQLLGITDKNKLGVVVYGKEYVGVSGGSTSNNSCDDTTKPVDNEHINFIIGNPTSKNQAYVQNSSNCGYSCKDGYSGVDCEIVLTIGQNMSLVSGETIFYAGEYQGRILQVAGTGTTLLLWKDTATDTPNASNEVDGRTNTGTFNSQHPASNYCQTLNRAGYDDWYLPGAASSGYDSMKTCDQQVGEMQYLYCQHYGANDLRRLGFAWARHWSSTQVTETASRKLVFNVAGSVTNIGKTNPGNVRCIRQAN